MNKVWLKRVIVVVAIVVGIISLGANVYQHSMYADLKERYEETGLELSQKITEKDNEIAKKELTIKALQRDLADEKCAKDFLQDNLDELLDVTLEYYENQAAEKGFNPDELDWIYAGKGRWYFFYYE